MTTDIFPENLTSTVKYLFIKWMKNTYIPYYISNYISYHRRREDTGRYNGIQNNALIVKITQPLSIIWILLLKRKKRLNLCEMTKHMASEKKFHLLYMFNRRIKIYEKRYMNEGAILNLHFTLYMLCFAL